MAQNYNRGPNNDNEIYSYSPQAKKAELKGSRKKSKIPWKGATAIVLSLLMIVCGSGLLIFYSTIQSVVYTTIGDDNGVVNTSKVSSPKDVDLDVFSGKLLNDPMILNVMLFGEDNRKSGEGHGRSDTMLLLSIDNRHKRLKLTSFLRDMLVEIPGVDDAGQPYGKDKLNASYSLGGAALSVRTIESNFGVEIDRYAIVNFNSFKEIIDILGGIDIEITQDEIDYINWQTYLNGQSEERYEITDKPGVVHLIGRQALWYARNRGYEEEEHPEFVVAGNDFDRTSRQRNLLKTLLADFKKANLAQIVQIIGKIGPMIETNFTKDEIASVVSNSLTYLGYENEEHSLPAESYFQYDWYNGQSILRVTDWPATRYELAKFIYEDSVKQNASHLQTDPNTAE